MLMKSKMKKIVSLLTIVFMLASFTPVFADEIVDSIFDWDFTGAVVDMTGKKVNDSTGNERLRLSNNSSWTVSPSSDDTYGSTLVLNRTAASTRGLFTNIEADDGASRNLVIKTAVKRTVTPSCDADILLDGAYKPISFSGGYIYINGTQESELTYAYDTWYEVTIEYSPSTGISKVTIDGGIYDNVSFYGEVGQHALSTMRFRVAHDITTNQTKGDMHIGYLTVGYNDDVKDATVFDRYVDFEDEAYTIGSTWQSYAFDQSGTWNEYADGMRYNINPNSGKGSAQDLTIAQLDEEHGKSLRLERNGRRTQLYYPLAAPFSRNITDGVLVFEHSVYGAKGTAIRPSIWYSYVDSAGVAQSEEIYLAVVAGAKDGILSSNEWHKVVAVVDADGGTYDMYSYQEDNPSGKKTIASGNFVDADNGETFTAVTRVDFHLGQNESSYTQDPSAPEYIYLDDIAIYTSADLAVDKTLNVDDASKSALNTPVVTVFNAPISSADVKLTCNGTEVAATKTIVGKTVSVIPASGVFEAGSEYQLEITEATDVFGNKLNHTTSFATGDKVDIDYTLAGSTLSFDFASNMGKVSLKFAVATYNKTTNELVNLTFYSNSSTEAYSTEVALSSDANHYSKLLVWDDDNTPYIDSVTFGQ